MLIMQASDPKMHRGLLHHVTQPAASDWSVGSVAHGDSKCARCQPRYAKLHRRLIALKECTSQGNIYR